MWTLDELVDRVGTALVAAEYPGAPNARVRDVPDRRAVRWYATTGLVDRPSAMRGRVALYGPRHLLQLVAVKRRQAEGRSLAEIQVELAGATDPTLAAIARVPEELLVGGGPTALAAPARARFWAAPPSPVADRPVDPASVVARPVDPASAGATPARPVALGTRAAALGGPAVEVAALGGPAVEVAAPGAPAVEVAAPGAPSVAVAPAAALAGVSLGRGAVLLVPGRPAPDDMAAIGDAARPLLALLAERGLLAGGEPVGGQPAGGDFDSATPASSEADGAETHDPDLDDRDRQPAAPDPRAGRARYTHRDPPAEPDTTTIRGPRTHRSSS